MLKETQHRRTSACLIVKKTSYILFFLFFFLFLFFSFFFSFFFFCFLFSCLFFLFSFFLFDFFFFFFFEFFLFFFFSFFFFLFFFFFFFFFSFFLFFLGGSKSDFFGINFVTISLNILKNVWIRLGENSFEAPGEGSWRKGFWRRVPGEDPLAKGFWRKCFVKACPLYVDRAHHACSS